MSSTMMEIFSFAHLDGLMLVPNGATKFLCPDPQAKAQQQNVRQIA